MSSYYWLNPYRRFDEKGLLEIDQTFDIFIILVYCAILTELTHFIGRKLNYYISWEQNPVFRAIAQFICLIAGNSLLNMIFSSIWDYLYPCTALEENDLVTIWQSKIMAAIISLLMSATLILVISTEEKSLQVAPQSIPNLCRISRGDFSSVEMTNVVFYHSD